MTRSVLVTGGAGFVGSHACKALAQAGYLPVVLDNLSEGHRSAVKWGPLVEGDLCDADLVRRTLREHDITAVMHFAAHAYVGESMQAPRKYFHNNVINSLALLDAAVECGVRAFVFSSTCATYGLPQTLPIDEAHPQVPVNPYGESKLFVEKALRWYERAYGLRAVALRYFNAAGADPDGEIGETHRHETHLIPLALRAALGAAPLDVYGTDYATPDGTAIRDYVHVSDLAAAHVLALDYLLAGGASAAFNLGTGQGHSVRQVIDAVSRTTGRKIAVRESARRPGDPPVLIACPERARTMLGWSPRFSDLATIVGSAWNWHCPEPRGRTASARSGGRVPQTEETASAHVLGAGPPDALAVGSSAAKTGGML